MITRLVTLLILISAELLIAQNRIEFNRRKTLEWVTESN